MRLTAPTTPIDHGMDAIKKRLEVLRLRGAYVKAGVMGSKARNDGETLTNAQLASIHEFGLGNAPARPFIRPPFLAHREEYLALLRKSYNEAIIRGDAKAFERVLALIGFKMAADIKNYVTQGAGVPPPLAASTIALKGSSRPLVDTGQLVNSITSEVVR